MPVARNGYSDARGSGDATRAPASGPAHTLSRGPKRARRRACSAISISAPAPSNAMPSTHGRTPGGNHAPPRCQRPARLLSGISRVVAAANSASSDDARPAPRRKAHPIVRVVDDAMPQRRILDAPRQPFGRGERGGDAGHATQRHAHGQAGHHPARTALRDDALATFLPAPRLQPKHVAGVEQHRPGQAQQEIGPTHGQATEVAEVQAEEAGDRGL